MTEADHLIRNGQVWVHYLRCNNAWTLASIVAFTRNTDSIATITKVFTDPGVVSRGCATRLVRRVCKESVSFSCHPRVILNIFCRLLVTKREITLFVGVNNSATKVYDRVGFVGLAPNSPPVDGVNPWSEIGFDRAHVELGHW